MTTDRHNIAPYPLRLSPELRSRLEGVAKQEGRSLHAEIVSRLDKSFSPGADAAALAALAYRIASLDEGILMNQHFLSDVSQLGKYVVERFLSPNKPTPEELEQILESFSLFIIQQDKEGRQKDVDEKYEAFKAAQRRLRHLANLTLEQMRDTDITRRLEKAALDALATTADPESRSPAETKTDADNQESGAVLAPSKLLGKN